MKMETNQAVECCKYWAGSGSQFQPCPVEPNNEEKEKQAVGNEYS